MEKLAKQFSIINIGHKSIRNILIDAVEDQYKHKNKINIWENSEWKHINELENDYVGKVGENFISSLCKQANIECNIDGIGNKKIMGGNGDGTILSHTVEIKTARIGSTLSSFQHELGEKPWLAEYMIFVDITPEIFYITIFKNFSEDFYLASGKDKSIKCYPYFPTKSICWRKQQGAFKLDTTVAINNKCKNTFKCNNNVNLDDFRNFITQIVV